jgi:lipid II:glycine glycyltransferase (peptidoglycan interpeptide bridge formation enzyme)
MVNIKGFTRLRSNTLIIDLTKDLDQIFQNIKRRCREYIIETERNQDIKININKNPKEFYNLCYDLKKYLHLNFRERLNTLKPKEIKKYGTLFTAEYNNNLLGGLLLLENDSHIFLLESASYRDDTNRERMRILGKINRRLYWEAIKYAKEKGLREFDFGGVWPEEQARLDLKKQGINFFKLSFGGEIVRRFSYQKIYSRFLKMTFHLYK